LPQRVRKRPRTWGESRAEAQARDAARVARYQARKALRAREEKALLLWVCDRSPDEVARECGYSTPSGAFRARKRMLKRIRLEPEEERIRIYMQARKIAARFVAKALTGDAPAANVVKGFHERMCVMLGLDAPARSEVSGPGGTPIAVTHDVAPLREALFRVVERHPEARKAIADALLTLDGATPEAAGAIEAEFTAPPANGRAMGA